VVAFDRQGQWRSTFWCDACHSYLLGFVMVQRERRVEG
jgi:hypothetical protein